jgi:hypothetical protein
MPHRSLDRLQLVGDRSGAGLPFNAGIVCHWRNKHRLASRAQRLQLTPWISVAYMRDTER